jgi:hypothetical protein
MSLTLHTITYVLHKTNMPFSYLSLISYELSNVRTNTKNLNFKFLVPKPLTHTVQAKICDLESQAQASLSKGCKKAAGILKETDRQMS